MFSWATRHSLFATVLINCAADVAEVDDVVEGTVGRVQVDAVVTRHY